ncbi:MAG: hypothetical protein EXX96DRAFT_584330 [Benjaminiella poitrasii]|nr:MAG: hypothetical protein EXX96DRAFT_584330 [Benjaminiella poitrasii]
MATLDSFGFSRGSKGKPVNRSSSQQQLAFISPSTLIKQNNVSAKQQQLQVIKPVKCSKQIRSCHPKTKNNNKNTITRYFASTPSTAVTMEIDQTEEEASVICIVRNKKPFSNLWNDLQTEFDLDDDEEDARLLSLDKENENSNKSLTRKRRNNMEEVAERQKKIKGKEQQQMAIDIDLSQFMVRSLNLNMNSQTASYFNSNSNTRLNMLMQQYQQKESLTRVLRCKMSIEESQLLVKRIEQEFLYS